MHSDFFCFSYRLFFITITNVCTILIPFLAAIKINFCVHKQEQCIILYHFNYCFALPFLCNFWLLLVFMRTWTFHSFMRWRFDRNHGYTQIESCHIIGNISIIKLSSHDISFQSIIKAIFILPSVTPSQLTLYFLLHTRLIRDMQSEMERNLIIIIIIREGN